jgi:S-adenosylmethionine synthetase
MVDTFRTGRITLQKIRDIIWKNFDLTPRGIINYLDLRRPIYKKTAAYGHFGRLEPEFTWEKVNKADDLRKDAGL